MRTKEVFIMILIMIVIGTATAYFMRPADYSLIDTDKAKREVDSLKTVIKNKDIVLDSINSEYEVLLSKFNDSTGVQVIREGYEIEINRVRNLPIDSTVSNLSKWLSKGAVNR